MFINFLYLILNSVESGIIFIEDIFTCGVSDENINNSISMASLQRESGFQDFLMISEAPANILENQSLDQLLLLENLVNSLDSSLTNIETSLEETEIELLTPINRATPTSHSFGFFMNQYTFFRDLSVVNIGSLETFRNTLHQMSELQCDEKTLRKWNTETPLFSFLNPLPHLIIIINNYLKIIEFGPYKIMGDVSQLDLFYKFHKICGKDAFWESYQRLEFLHQIRAEKNIQVKEKMIRNWVDKYALFIEDLKKFQKNNSQDFYDSQEVKEKREGVLQQMDKIQNNQLNEIKILVNEISNIIRNNKKNV